MRFWDSYWDDTYITFWTIHYIWTNFKLHLNIFFKMIIFMSDVFDICVTVRSLESGTHNLAHFPFCILRKHHLDLSSLFGFSTLELWKHLVYPYGAFLGKHDMSLICLLWSVANIFIYILCLIYISPKTPYICTHRHISNHLYFDILL